MGKSNKFDYTNRPNSGAKLGQIIGHALEKEANKLQKDAEKQANKTRKQSISSSSVGSSDGRDILVHVLDIRAPSKQLGDEGACALADGLEIALRKGSSQASLALEDLNISDNGITTVSLARLAPIIELAKHDLKTVNLADNNIQVNTAEEARQWEVFLVAFKDCLKLRRLDLSGNRSLGAKALETLARIHLREDLINAMPASGDASVYSLTDVHCDDEEDMKTPTQAEWNDDDDVQNSSMAHARYIRRRCGLRSVPYLTLRDIGLTDAGALWLSYVLEDHHYPSQLMDELNATQVDSTIKSYQQGVNFRGIEWNEHEASLGKDGAQLLQKTEVIRQLVLLDNRSTETEADPSDHSECGSDDNGHDSGLRISVDRSKYPRAPVGSRRTSIRSIRTTDGGEHEVSEVESARKKIQRSIIAQYGASSVDLWRSALRAVVTYRILLFSKPFSRVSYISSPLFHFPSMNLQNQGRDPARSSWTATRNDSANPLRRLGPIEGGFYNPSRSVHSKDVVGQPELAIKEVTNTTSNAGKKIFKPHRKGAFGEGSDVQSVGEMLDNLKVQHISSDRFVQWQRERMSNPVHGGPDGFRDTSIPSHLPSKLIDRILSEVMSETELSVMTQQQKEAAFAWARNRANFDTQSEWRKMADSAQVWTLLECIGCLTYGK